jgi:archaeosortase family protein ArtF
VNSQLVARTITALLTMLLVWIILGHVGGLLLELEAASTSSVLSLLGIDHVRLGDTIYIRYAGETVGFRIEWHCSGLVTYTLFTVLVVVIPLGAIRRLYWLLLGFFVIYFVNVLRILLIIIVARMAGVEKAALIHSVAAPILLFGTLIYLSVEVLRNSLWRARKG